MNNNKMYIIQCAVEIGCICEVNAKSEKEAIRKIKEEGWNWNIYESDRSHFSLVTDVMEVRER